MAKMSTLEWIGYWLVIIGALNWLLIGLVNFNLVVFIGNLFGSSGLVRLIYILVGISGLWGVYMGFSGYIRKR